MRISDWSSDVCSSDLGPGLILGLAQPGRRLGAGLESDGATTSAFGPRRRSSGSRAGRPRASGAVARGLGDVLPRGARRSEEHTSELQSLMRISYAVFCLKKKKQRTNKTSIRRITTHKNIVKTA